MGRMRSAALLVVLTWLLALGPGIAHAQSAPEDQDSKARHLYRNGEILYAEGRYGDAIAAWQSAYRLSDRPLLLFNIANAQERLGRWEDALNTLNRYRAYAAADERDTLSLRIANIERNIRERQVQGPAPLVRPQPQAEPAPMVRPDPVVRRDPPVRRPRPQARPQSTPSRRGLSRGPVTLFAVSGAGALTGGIFAYRAQAARAAAVESCDGQGTIFCPTSAQTALQQDRISSIVADVGFGVGLTCAVAGTLMAVTSKNTSNRTTMSLAPAVGGASLGLSSRF